MDDVLTSETFIDAVIDGARAHYLAGWSDALIEAVATVGPAYGSTEVAHLCGLLRKAVAARRSPLDPFSSYLEAPRSIIDLYQAHTGALRSAAAHVAEATEPLISDTAAAAFSLLDGPLPWRELEAAGAVRERPGQPRTEWDYIAGE